MQVSSSSRCHRLQDGTSGPRWSRQHQILPDSLWLMPAVPTSSGSSCELMLPMGSCRLRGQHIPLVPGTQLAPVDPESRSQAHHNRLKCQARPSEPSLRLVPMYEIHMANPPADFSTGPNCPRTPAASHPMDITRISGGLCGEGLCLPKPVYKDWKRCLLPQTCRHEGEAVRITIQGNTPPKEINKIPMADYKEMDIHDSFDKEFKIILLKKSSEPLSFHSLYSFMMNRNSDRFCYAAFVKLAWYCQQNSFLIQWRNEPA